MRSFNGPEPGGPESTTKKVKERKRLIFLGLHRKPVKLLIRGLLCSWRPQTPSRWGEGAEHLLERVLEAQAGKWTQRASVLQGISLKKRERETERERKIKKDMGTKPLMEQRCFNQHGVGIYTVFSSVQSFSHVRLFATP